MGPTILARTMSAGTSKGKSSRLWQYHSRSDSHSKIACWTLLFDLLLECDVLRSAAAAGKVGFGINYVMVGPINKTLDLVLTWDPDRSARKGRAFAELVRPYGIKLDGRERVALEGLPPVEEYGTGDSSEVAIAIEAKACMTEHVKSLPRLHAEILATGYLAKLAVRHCIAVSYSLVNAAPTFVTPSADSKVNSHAQPAAARSVVNMLAAAIPWAKSTSEYGYDAIGVTVLDCRNDGTPVEVVHDRQIGPQKDDPTHYERMVRSVCSQFRARFGRT